MSYKNLLTLLQLMLRNMVLKFDRNCCDFISEIMVVLIKINMATRRFIRPLLNPNFRCFRHLAKASGTNGTISCIQRKERRWYKNSNQSSTDRCVCSSEGHILVAILLDANNLVTSAGRTALMAGLGLVFEY